MATRTLDPYAVLGIPPGASRDEAARAHRRLAKAYHPDLNPGPAAAERMRRINAAWRILSNPARRARHDLDRRGAGWAGAASRTGAGTATWTTWPPPRHAVPRSSRPPRRPPVEPSFGDRREVVFIGWAVFALLLFVGTWLGSLPR